MNWFCWWSGHQIVAAHTQFQEPFYSPNGLEQILAQTLLVSPHASERAATLKQLPLNKIQSHLECIYCKRCGKVIYQNQQLNELLHKPNL